MRKRVKTFRATWKPAGDLIRVVLVKEGDGWRAYFCTKLGATAEEVLEAVADRGAIENVFQQITEVFELRQLIGGTPQATVFQAAFCLVLDNLVQVMRAYVAAGRPEPTPVASLSAEKRFDDIREELVALQRVLGPAEVPACLPRPVRAAELVGRLRGLLGRAWSPEGVKATNAPRRRTAKAKRSGAHTSVHRVLQAHRRPVARASGPPG